MLHEDAGYDYESIPRLHASEVRRYLEGRRQRALDKQHARKTKQQSSASPGVAKRKQELEANRQAARADLLDEVGGGD